MKNKTSDFFFPLLFVFGAATGVAHATNIVISNNDGPGEGFNDTTPASPVPGNPGTTLGQQRLNVFQAAADYWETKLDSDVDIVVRANFDPQICTQFGAILGSAGPRAAHYNFPNAPKSDTWYPAALANSLAGQDLSTTAPDIGATFNSNLDSDPNCLGGQGWNYEIGEPTGSPLELYNVVLHELAHGLGFLTLTNKNTGAKRWGKDDVYLTFLRDQASGQDLNAMTDAQRAAAFVNTGNLVWKGTRAVTEADFLTSGKNAGYPQMFAPPQIQGGSSVSHWDTALQPNEVMEPTATSYNEDWLTIKAFYDMGWQGEPCLSIAIPDNQWIMFSLECEPPSGENDVASLIGDDIAPLFGGNVTLGETGYGTTTWVVYEYVPGSGYQMLGLNDPMEMGKGYWIIQKAGADVMIDIPRDSHRTPVTNPNACTSPKGCYELVLATSPSAVQWNMVGNMFLKPVKVDDLRVVTDSGVCASGCTLAEAQSNSIVHNQFWTFGGGSSSYTVLGAGDTIPARAAFWVAALDHADGLSPRILVPYK